ncbi:MAG: hypothetical protein KDK91_28375 [Gammaproteobacteria bacterium]|nr:hypothetical protein [Gammaproteobacteria bacterium]
MSDKPDLTGELQAFYRRHGFGEVVGARALTVPVYTGCLLVPLPDIETRRRYLKYHDLHHIATGYSVGRIGEGEVSAWELGTGSARCSPMLAFMNLIALSTGLFLAPRRMWHAFCLGCRSRNLYTRDARAAVESDRWPDSTSLRRDILDVREPLWASWIRALVFATCCILSLAIHVSIAGPAVVARFITDISLGYSIFQAVKPRKRSDLY